MKPCTSQCIPVLCIYVSLHLQVCQLVHMYVRTWYSLFPEGGGNNNTRRRGRGGGRRGGEGRRGEARLVQSY